MTKTPLAKITELCTLRIHFFVPVDDFQDLDSDASRFECVLEQLEGMVNGALDDLVVPIDDLTYTLDMD